MLKVHVIAYKSGGTAVVSAPCFPSSFLLFYHLDMGLGEGIIW